MFTNQYENLKKEMSGQRAFDYLSSITSHHRIRVSKGFKESAKYVHDTLRDFGIDTEIHEYTADGQTSFWGDTPLQLEWQINNAQLCISSPEKHRQKLADYEEDKLSVIQRTGPTPPEGICAEVVQVDKADRPESYEEVDVKGKFVLCSSDPQATYRNAVVKNKAVGIITDNMPELNPVRQLMELPGARSYSSFWFGINDDPCPGFVLTPRQGAKLRRLIDKSDEPVKLHADVDSSFSASTMQVVNAFLPGETDEEIIVTAHLCHPQQSANDNASGVAAAMEAARALKYMLDEETLPPLKRGIRFLFIPEMAGTTTFLQENESNLQQYIAGVNLDMVGQDQNKCGGTLLAEYPPRSTPSFTGDLVGLLMANVGNEHKNLAGTTTYPSYKWTEAAFSGGSDHMIMSDPTVGIPAPMIIQWPDKYYHTSEDTPDKIDPNMLEKVANITGMYTHFIATAEERETIQLGAAMVSKTPKMLNNMKDRITGLLKKGEKEKVDRLLEFFTDRRKSDVMSLESLADIREDLEFFCNQIDTIVDITRNICCYINDVGALSDDSSKCNESASDYDNEQKTGRENIVPQRKYRGPVFLKTMMDDLNPKTRKKWRSISKKRKSEKVGFTHALYWANGSRSLSEIGELVYLECGIDLSEHIKFYFEMLEELGQVTLARN